VEGRRNERDFYREIVGRAKRVRERAAESLRRSRALRVKQEDLGDEAGASEGRRRFRRRD
jgi:hypothetical protein